jgi:hypothetical protein
MVGMTASPNRATPRIRYPLFMHQTYSVLTVDDNQIAAVTRELVSANTLRVTVGTNCPKAQGPEQGGRTVLVLEADTGADLTFEASERSKKVSLVFDGDSECDSLIDALEFAASTLRTMQHANRAARRAAIA